MNLKLKNQVMQIRVNPDIKKTLEEKAARAGFPTVNSMISCILTQFARYSKEESLTDWIESMIADNEVDVHHSAFMRKTIRERQ